MSPSDYSTFLWREKLFGTSLPRYIVPRYEIKAWVHRGEDWRGLRTNKNRGPSYLLMSNPNYSREPGLMLQLYRSHQNGLGNLRICMMHWESSDLATAPRDPEGASWPVRSIRLFVIFRCCFSTPILDYPPLRLGQLLPRHSLHYSCIHWTQAFHDQL